MKNPDAKLPKKVVAATAKAAAHRAFEAGTVKAAYDLSSRVVKVLADAQVEADGPLRQEIRLMQAAAMRFRAKTRLHVQAKAGALAQAMKDMDKLERLLEKAQGPGFGIVAAAHKAEVDFNRVRQLRASLAIRAREMAFVLAELEQLVDPYPGLKLATAAARKRNDKLRSEALKAKDVSPKPPSQTSEIS